MVKNSVIPLHPFHCFIIHIFLMSCLHFIVNGSQSVLLDQSKTIKSCSSTEREALLVFKRGLKDEGDLLSSWSNDEHKNNCCQWRGVRCSNKTGHVTALDLSSSLPENITRDGVLYNLGGKLSPSLAKLNHLRYLNLSNNQFGYNEPIPKFIGSLVELRYLDLSYCSFYGTIPFQLGNLSKLWYLDISHNSYFYAEPIPMFIGSLVELRHLDLSYCVFHGVNPSHLGNLSKLLYFDISNNFGGGNNVIDNLTWLSNLTSLIYLDMSSVDLSRSTYWLGTIMSLPSLSYVALAGCFLTNSVPSFSDHSLFESSTSISTLILSYNNLKGPIPQVFGNMTSLTHLHLDFNQLQGMIPKSFGGLCNLQTLEMGHNNFSGNLVDFLEKFTGCVEVSLHLISIFSTQLKGSLPDITRYSSIEDVILFDNVLDGYMPKEFKHCDSLLHLDLSKGKMRGPLPDFTGCSSLQALNLYGNQFNGPLHESIGRLSELESLDVSQNFLEGVISEVHLFNLTKLKYLGLSFNRNLTIELRSGWVPPFQLEDIALHGCKLGPRFPRWIRSQTNIMFLDISKGKIADTIPMWFWNHSTSNLKYFHASSNAITGELPDLSLFSGYFDMDLGFNLLEGLIPLLPPSSTSLNLSGNKFSGDLSFICAINDGVLSILDISRNHLSGEIPDHCFKKLNAVIILDLSHNKLSGTIPSSIGSLLSVTTMDLQNNSFSGELPISFKNCTSLKFLNLGENNFSGTIPSWIGESLSELYILILKSNRFNGSIPLHLCILVKLQLLDLSANNLSGNIPKCFNNFTTMVQKGFAESYFNDTAFVQWKGTEREFSERLIGQLKSIDLSRNELTGELPDAIINLVQMISLNISRNKLHGVLPNGIGQLVSLESLDLSRNMFSGAIPLSMSALHFLSYLDLSYNNFSGRIPSGTQLQSFNASQYMGNDELCGLPITPNCPGDPEGTQTPPVTVGSELDDDDDEFDRWFYIGSAVGFAVSFWVVAGSLLFYRPWRHAYFLLLGKIKDRLCVMIAVRWRQCVE